MTRKGSAALPPARKKPGPKTHLMNGVQRRRTGTWDDHTEEMLRAIGGGSRSEGVRRAASFTYRAYQQGTEITR